MPKVTEEHLEARRQQIIDAAFLCFAQKGFHPTTMQDICTTAHLSPGAVYRYFSSKEEIILAACGETQERNLPFLAGAVEEPDYRKLISVLADYFFAQVDGAEGQVANRAMVQVWAEAVVNERVGEMNLANMAEVRSYLRTMIVAAQRKGDIAAHVDAEALARVMVSIYNGFQLQKALEPDVDTASYIRAAVALFTGGLEPGSSGKGVEQGNEGQLTGGAG